MGWSVSGVDRVREDHLVGCVIDAVEQLEWTLVTLAYDLRPLYALGAGLKAA
jgi:hypothetical protein